jgi:hypothetical protein
MIRGDQLVERLGSGRLSPEERDEAATELLNEIFDGFPVERLRPLLHSNDEGAVRAGAWIASELGEEFEPLMTEVGRLLDHPVRDARFFALDIVLNRATGELGSEIAQAVALSGDADDAVRWKALRFLSAATEEQLTASLPNLEDEHVAAQTAWLVSSDALDSRQVTARLTAVDGLVRKFAAAAAARIFDRDPVPLQRAASSPDAEVRSFATDEIAIRSRRRLR